MPVWSTKDAGQKPFSFQIGMGAVIKAWDEGVMGMQLGEVARLTATPDYGCAHITSCPNCIAMRRCCGAIARPRRQCAAARDADTPDVPPAARMRAIRRRIRPAPR